MKIRPSKNLLAAAMTTALIGFSSTANAEDELPSKAEMWKIIQQQQAQINTLLGQQAKTKETVEKTAEKVEETAEKISEVEELASIAPAQGGGSGWFQNTQLGGYGELHYNGGEEDEIDFHRFVLFIGHEFNDRIRLFSELELEHALAGEGKNGEVELEQAFIEFDLDEDAEHKARTGVFLIPVGILNEVHEPTTFFGVERNNVEKNIIPTTWWEGGVAYNGQLGNGFSTDVAVHSGLSVDTDFKIRGGRQKVSEARAEDPAITGRVKWTGMPGVELAATAQYQRDVRQSLDAESSPATLLTAHANVRKGPFGFRTLAARWDIDSTSADALGRDVQQGWYAEPAYFFDTPIGEAGVFARYEYHDNTAGDNTDSEIEEITGGVNVWPHKNVVLKADFQHIEASAAGDSSDDRVNLGVGYTF